MFLMVQSVGKAPQKEKESDNHVAVAGKLTRSLTGKLLWNYCNPCYSHGYLLFHLSCTNKTICGGHFCMLAMLEN